MFKDDPMLLPRLVGRKVERRTDQERFGLSHGVIPAIELQSQKSFLDEIVRVIGAATAAAEQFAKLREQLAGGVHTGKIA
jgi:hypothetical protein